MAKILKKLSCLEFPESSRLALQYITSCLTSPSGGAIPGLGGSNDYVIEVSQEYILNKKSRPGPPPKKLNAVQELQLLEMVCSCLQSAPQASRYSIFNVLFGGQTDEVKLNLLTKLVSMSLSIGSGAVLDCAALWMQEQGCYSKTVCDLSHKLVEDYCLLFPDVSSTFAKLPSVSPLFCCNFVTAVVTIYPFHELVRCPPPVLLHYITEWVSSDPCLCSESVRLVRIQSSFSCPFFGLVQWCTLGHLLCSASKSDKSSSAAEHSKMLPVLSRLHFSVLQSLQAYKSMELNEELFHLSHFVSLASEIQRVYNLNRHCVEIEEFQMLVERLGQVIQVAVVTGCIKINPGSKEIQAICEILPDNRLLKIIARQWITQQPMDTT